MKKASLLLSLLLIISSCSKESDNPDEYNPSDKGVFIINEGNFGGGTGSLSFYSYKSGKVYNDLFSTINGWPLGDVAFSMNTTGQKAFIVVNNSGKIEVVDKNTLVSLSTISELISPRNISFTGDNKAYVTSIYSDSLAIIDLSDHSISGYININRSSESIISYGNKAYVSHWVGGNEIIVVNTLLDQVIDSITVGKEPESMVLDKNNKLWVLCNGGWARENFAELIRINTENNEIEQTFIFPAITDSPSCLQIDGQGETLYFIKNGVQKMDIGASSLPSQAFIPESEQYFYKIGINPDNGDVFITDAADYQQKGSIMRYNKDGALLITQKADIIPAFLYFKN
jgi:hypothetical protein